MQIASRRVRRVAVIAESAVAPRRRLLAGITRYMREHELWAVYLKPWLVEKSLGHWVSQWDGDGIISAAWGPEAHEVAMVSIPTVDVTGHLAHLGVPLVHTNDFAVGIMAAEHLLERGFRHFGFVGYPAKWSVDRLAGFSSALKKHGLKADTYELKFPVAGVGGPANWEKQQRAMSAWASTLPKPAGVMTCTDSVGQQFLESCLRADLVVPEQIAVIGADNDELVCEISNPPLSSVIIDDFRRGYLTAQLLDQLMNGQAVSPTTHWIEPPGVACRASTDILAIEDQSVARALRFVRDHACDPISVDQVVRSAAVSRRLLEQRFRKLLGRSINDEIVRIRLDRAVQLLTATDLELKAVALKCGFSTPSYMGVVFQSRLKRTPASFRDRRSLQGSQS